MVYFFDMVISYYNDLLSFFILRDLLYVYKCFEIKKVLRYGTENIKDR